MVEQEVTGERGAREVGNGRIGEPTRMGTDPRLQVSKAVRGNRNPNGIVGEDNLSLFVRRFEAVGGRAEVACSRALVEVAEVRKRLHERSPQHPALLGRSKVCAVDPDEIDGAAGCAGDLLVHQLANQVGRVGQRNDVQCELEIATERVRGLSLIEAVAGLVAGPHRVGHRRAARAAHHVGPGRPGQLLGRERLDRVSRRDTPPPP